MTKKLSLNQRFIEKLASIIEANILNNQFGVSELAAETGLSRSQLHRKLKTIIGKSSSQFIREYRLERAMEMLKENSATVSEISFQVGFTSPSYFNSRFNQFYGYPPGEVKFRKTEAPIVIKKKKQHLLFWIAPIVLIIAVASYFVYFNKAKVDVTKIDKSIAVLPFINDSSNKENQYFCNGIMAGIRDKLAKVPDFTVVSRVSAEKYRDSTMTLKQIAEELGVSYVVEGRVQRVDNRAIITTELIYATDNKLLWSKHYDKDVSEIFKVQSDVVESISANLQAVISSDVKIYLNQIPTRDELAYDHYLKAEEYRFKANRSEQKIEVWLNFLDKAQLSYELAIERDSLFAEAYVGLAENVNDRKIPYMLEENSLDDVLIFANKAIQINPNLSDAYAIRGEYYVNTNQIEIAKKDFEKALSIDPSNGIALNNLSRIYRLEDNHVGAIIALKKMEKLVSTEEDLMRVYTGYRFYYGMLDDHQTDEYYLNKISQIDTTFSGQQLWFFIKTKQFKKGVAYINRTCPEDNQQKNGFLALTYHQMGQTDRALAHLEKWHQQVLNEGVNCYISTRSYVRYGHVLINSGEKQKGIAMMQKQIKVYDQLIATGRIDQGIYYDLVGLYASLGQYEKAYENMKKVEDLNGWVMWGGLISYVKFDVSVDILRDNQHFQDWVKRGEKQLEITQNEIRPYLTTEILD